MTTPQLAMAKRMINAAICTYQIHPAGWQSAPGTPPPLKTVEGPGFGYFYDVYPVYQDAVEFARGAAQGYTPLFTSDGRDDIDAGLVGAMADGNLLVAIRGTIPPTLDDDDIAAWIADWHEDSDIVPMAWKFGSRLPTKARVATGFGVAMRALWPKLLPMIRQTLTANPCTGVVVTGHSKGAALAFLCATLVARTFPQFAGRIQVHAFAAPAAVNTEFLRQYLPLAPTTHRYQMENDLVPFVPLWASADMFEKMKTFDPIGDPLWNQIFADSERLTDGGYEAPGDLTYFDYQHQLIPNAKVQTSAMPALAFALKSGKFREIAAAHSAVNSYLPCFP